MTTDDSPDRAGRQGALERLVHRLNNLLGTIDIQVDVARDAGSLETHAQALRYIAESAAKTKETLRDVGPRLLRAERDQEA